VRLDASRRGTLKVDSAGKSTVIKPEGPRVAGKIVKCMHRMRNGAMKMAMLTVRNISDEVHRTLRMRAAQHGRSMEAEVREILESAVSPAGRVKLGSLLADMGRQAKLTEQEFAVFAQVRDKSPGRPPSFE